MSQNGTMPSPGQGMPSYTDDNRADLLIGTIFGFVGFASIFVALRIYVRAIVLKKWGADDWLVVVSYILTFVTGAVFSICTRYGLSRHIWTVPVEVQQAGRRMTIAATLGYHLTFITIKMAFLLQFRRVFSVPKFHIFCDIMFVFICSFGIAVVVSSVVMSVPSWNGDTFASERFDQVAWWLATSAVHLVTDIVIFLMPIPFLSRLNVNKMQKTALIITFGIGFVTTGISIVRMTTITHVFTQDVTWDVIPALIWSEIELCCAVICACIPTLRPMLRVVRKGSDGRRSWKGQHSSEASDNSGLARRPLKVVTVSSQHSIPFPSPILGSMEMEQKMQEPTVQSSESGLAVRTEMSPVLTAGGASDDGSDEFGPVDEEVATPLSPPPKSYNSPTTSTFQISPEMAEEGRGHGC